MLKKLSIRNFVLIDEALIEFSPGLNILSGETGGGKSIIAAAIGLFAGGKGRPDYVRKGCDRAVIEGDFENAGGKQGVVTARREIDAGGRSRCYLGGEAVGTGRLREELGRLLCLTSQHEQVSLTDLAAHRAMLDEFGGLVETLEAHRALFGRWREETEKLRKMKDAVAEREVRMDYLRHQIKEIRGAALKPGEDEEIRSHLALVKNRGRISGALKLAQDELFEGEGSASAKLAKVSREIEKVASSTRELQEPARIMGDVQALVAELERSVVGVIEAIDFDEHSTDALQERLYGIERLKKKYRGGIEDILAGLTKMEEEASFLENYDHNLKEMEERAAKLGEELSAGVENLSRLRTRESASLRRAVMKELGDLAFKNVDFDVDVRSRKEIAGTEDLAGWIDEWGGDEVEFLLRPNEGEDFAPLRRIASGGELSRVLLALKVALRSGGRGETFVFDEIDVGIGGAVAEAVGRKLRFVGEFNQVICITHLPQIAVFGDRHLLVGKKVAGGRTVTYVTQLEGQGRVEELARMIAGEKITGKGREAASELLASAQSGKRHRERKGAGRG
jgi:DNA repair protein RecN (Recombination protein N)